MKYFNIHVHLFTGAYVPEGFYGREKAGLFAKIKHSVFGEYFIWILKWINPFNMYDAGNRLASLLRAGKLDSLEDNFLELTSNYQEWPNMQFVVLSLDTDYMGAGIPDINYLSQLQELVTLKYRYPNQVVPFICADPRRKQGSELKTFVEEYVTKKGFRGIKLYPALGFYPFDQRLKQMYAYAEQKSIPIITHCDRGGIHFQGKSNPYTQRDVAQSLEINPMEIAEATSIQAYHYRDGDRFWHAFTEPMAYFDLLIKYPKLKICFAHFGGDEELHKFLKKRKPLEDIATGCKDLSYEELRKEVLTKDLSWFEVICYLIVKFSNVYTDISYTLYDDTLFDLLGEAIAHPEIGDKVLFGTDSYLTERRKPENQLVNDFRNHIGKEQFQAIASINAERFLNWSADKDEATL